MSIDLSGLSAKELEALIAQAKKRRTTLSKRKPIALVRKKLTLLARAEGYTIAELFGGAPVPAASKGNGVAKTTARKSSVSSRSYTVPSIQIVESRVLTTNTFGLATPCAMSRSATLHRIGSASSPLTSMPSACATLTA